MKHRALAAFSAISLLCVPATVRAAKADPIELHVEASAQVTPDRALVPMRITGTGPDDAAAKSDLADQEERLISGLAKLGIDRGKVKVTSDPDGVRDVTMVEASACDAVAAANDAAAPRASKKRTPIRPVIAGCAVDDKVTLSKSITVELDDPSKLEGVQALSQSESYGRLRPVFSQSDPAAARKKARDLAIAKARAEADGFADAMGYRVVRITRVSNARPAMSFQDLIGFVATMDDRTSRMQPTWFAATVQESVAIDFEVAPK